MRIIVDQMPNDAQLVLLHQSVKRLVHGYGYMTVDSLSVKNNKPISIHVAF